MFFTKAPEYKAEELRKVVGVATYVFLSDESLLT